MFSPYLSPSVDWLTITSPAGDFSTLCDDVRDVISDVPGITAAHYGWDFSGGELCMLSLILSLGAFLHLGRLSVLCGLLGFGVSFCELYLHGLIVSQGWMLLWMFLLVIRLLL